MSASLSSRVIVLSICVAAACGAAHASVSQWGPCDPLVPSPDPSQPHLGCMLPFPNNYWLRNGSLEFGNDTFPLDNKGKPVRADYGGWNSLDGFSPLDASLAYFPNASIDNCARLWNISASMNQDSPTVLLNAETGERIPHWVELDNWSDLWETSDYRRLLMIWPQERLDDGVSYIVAIRNLVTTTGQPIKASPAFEALRDGTPSKDPSVNDRRAEYKGIFSKLNAAGVQQENLILAWQYTVATTPAITSRMVAVREDAMSRVANGFDYTVYDIQDDYSSTTQRKVQVTVQMPWYLNQAGPGSSVRLVLDSQGVPVFQGMQPVNFTLLVPRSLVANGTTGGVLQYGHGLFGSRSEVQEGYLDTEANINGWVLVASDWLGLSEYDAVAVALMLATDISNFAMVPDRCTQGMLNALLVMRLMKDQFYKDPSVIFNGKTVVDPSQRFYDGNSQGGILGTVYMATTTDVERGTIGVGGAPYSLLLPRSQDFVDLGAVISARYKNPMDRICLLSAMQLLWNRLEPAGYLHAISRQPLPNTPAHRIIIHYGLGDAQVTWMGGQQIGRGTDAVMFAGNVEEGNITLSGFPFVADDAVITSGNVIQGWDFGEPVVPFENVPPAHKYDTHEFTRRTLTAQQQMWHFFKTGEVKNFCGGACHAKPPM